METIQTNKPRDILNATKPVTLSNKDISKRLTYSQITRTLSRDYFKIFRVNMNTGEYVEYIPHIDNQQLDVERDGKDFFKDLEITFSNRIHPEDKEHYDTVINKENVVRVLSSGDVLTLNYRILIDGTPTYIRIKGTCIDPCDVSSVIVGVTNIDAHMQRLAEYERSERESISHSDILEALASDYFCIYYVDTITDDFKLFNASKQYLSLGINITGHDFFNDGTKFADLISEYDRAHYEKTFKKENVMSILSISPSFSHTFLANINGNMEYIQIKATRIEAIDNHHIVVALSNVDDRVRQEQSFSKSLREAQHAANIDSLTGVKSKYAFKEIESKLNSNIKDGTIEPFALTICDVNNLKIINDTQGHKAGDEYIISATHLICKLFKHSPVYRIGGDEFAVISKGEDYKNINTIIAKFNDFVEKNKKEGKVVISIGNSKYDSSVDTNIQTIFDRADKAMYERKKQLKQ